LKSTGRQQTVEREEKEKKRIKVGHAAWPLSDRSVLAPAKSAYNTLLYSLMHKMKPRMVNYGIMMKRLVG
jgi:hypothetical protein